MYQAPPAPPDLEIEMLKLFPALDKGYDDKGQLVDGMVYGKSYVVTAVLTLDGRYIDFVPIGAENIEWGFQYTDESGNVMSGKFMNNSSHMPATGNKLVLAESAFPLEFCGTHITIKATLNGKSSFIETFFHYRFRWFSRKQVKMEIEDRIDKNNPWKIDQNATSLCGMAAIYYIFAKSDPGGYKKMALELHQTGRSKYNDCTIQPGSSEMYYEDPTHDNKYPSNYRGLMPFIDWIVLASTRNEESSLGYMGKEGEDSTTINWPSILIDLMEKLLNYTDIYSNCKAGVVGGSITKIFKKDRLAELVEIEQAYQNGYSACMLIDDDMLYDKPHRMAINTRRWHWIVYEGGLSIGNGCYSFSYWCWGEQVHITRPFKEDVFNSNYYGYIKGKK